MTGEIGRFSRVPVWAAGVKELSRYDFRVLIAIAAHADKTGKARPGLSRIASTAQIDRRNVSRSITHLEKAGLIKHQAEKSGSVYAIIYGSGTSGGNGEYHHEPARETIERGAKNAAVADAMLEIWKEECGDALQIPAKLNRDRINACLARFKDSFNQDLEQWRALCREIRASPFCCGGGNRGWKANFDWSLKPNSILGVQEGKYHDHAPQRRWAASNGPVGFDDYFVPPLGPGGT